MKKLLCAALTATMLATLPCYGASLDYGSYSDGELQEIVDSARAELFARHQRQENGSLVICDTDGVQITLTGSVRLEFGGFLRMDATFVNNSNRTISVYGDKGYLNGWETYCSLDATQLAPGKKVRDDLVFLVDDAGISTIDEIEDITFTFHVTDSDTYDRFIESSELQVFLSEDKSQVVSVQEVYSIG